MAIVIALLLATAIYLAMGVLRARKERASPPSAAPMVEDGMRVWRVVVGRGRHQYQMVVVAATEGEALSEVLKTKVDPRAIQVLEPVESAPTGG
jgi:hypothetical protein